MSLYVLLSVHATPRVIDDRDDGVSCSRLEERGKQDEDPMRDGRSDPRLAIRVESRYFRPFLITDTRSRSIHMKPYEGIHSKL